MIARKLEAASVMTRPSHPRPRSGTTSFATVRLAATAMVLTQLVMVRRHDDDPRPHARPTATPSPTPAWSISIHIAAMFLPSPLTGQLVDRIGRRPMLAAGGSRC
jgi:MFS family permease